VYPQRWVILLVFSVSTLCNAMMWTTFAPISDSSSTYFFPDATTTKASTINLLALSYQITYLPGTILASYLVRDGGLMSPILVGSVLTSLGATTRYLAVVLPFPQPLKFPLTLLGQSIASLAQPCFVNSPGLLSANWFAVNERDVATTVASLFAIVGNAVGQVMPPLMVTGTEADNTDGNDTINGMEKLLLYQGLACIVCTLLVLLFFRSQPPTPPSESTANRDKRNRIRDATATTATTATNHNTHSTPLLENANDASVDTSRDSISRKNRVSLTNESPPAYSVSGEAMSLFKNKDYVMLFMAFGLGLSLFNALLTVMNNVLEPCGYTEDDAGMFAATLIGAGMVGAGFAGYAMDAYHAYRPLLKAGFASAGFACCALSASLKPDNSLYIYISFGILGFCMIPMLPVMIENSIECTYPVSEELSAGILFTAGNVIGIPVTLLMQYLIDITPDDECGNFFTPVNILLMVTAFVCGGFAMRYNGQYKRLEAEGLH
jgi:FLVCR family feline leukemia virus subgroup C receptor-related protein